MADVWACVCISYVYVYVCGGGGLAVYSPSPLDQSLKGDLSGLLKCLDSWQLRIIITRYYS